jgi:hypothetical protein
MVTLSKNLIEKLYRKERLSTIEVAKKLKTTTWTVLGFMARNNIPRRTFKEANKISFENKPLTFLLKSRLSAKDKKLKMAGVFLYWAEGAKASGKNCSVDFANSNSEMIRIFVRFLREICGVDKKRLRIFLYCYADQDIENIKDYWYKLTNIPKSQFSKPYVRSDFLPEKSGKMKYGLAHIRYADKKLLYQIDNWIKEYCKIL